MSIVELHARAFPGLFDPALEPVLFWGKSHPEHRSFSNFVGGPFFLPHPVLGELVSYASVEHFYIASKTLDLADHEWVRDAPRPKDAKRRGSPDGELQPDGTYRRIELRPDWEQVKFAVMLRGLRAKFTTQPFKGELLGTGLRYIAEDSPTDPIWGWRSPGGGHDGTNLLGLGLMLMRAQLRV